MRIFITGATGTIGRRLVLDRLERVDEVVLLSRDVERASKMFAAQANRKITVVQGNPATPGNWQEKVAGCDAVIHLAAAGIADKRWSTSYKQLLVNSRVDSTFQVVNAIEQAPPHARPKVLINGSATGYYGDAGDRELDESAPAGGDFLAKLSVPWEAQAMRAESLGLRVVLLRTGVVLDDRGGALGKLMLPFKFFIGGPLGSGRQFMPWIHWRDLMGLIDLALEEPNLMGALNAVAPQAVRQRELAAELGAVMNRPSFVPAPRIGLRIIMGEMANVLTSSQRAVPAKAKKFGYSYLYPELEPALRDLIGGRPESIDAESARQAAPRFPITPTSDENASPRSEAMPQVPIRLCAIAVDGTLLRSDGSVAQGVVQACRAAERAGCVIVLATARPPRGTKPIVQAMDITGPTINYNGAVIWNPLDEKPQFHEPLAGELAQQIIVDAKAIQPDLAFGLEILDRWHVDRIDPQFEVEIARLGQPDSVGPLETLLRAAVTKLTVIGAPEKINPVLEMIRERYWRPRSVAVFLSDPRLIQITHPMVDKGIALQRIAKRMGLNREQVMAIGDSANDMGMLEWAGFGVAVENASTAVCELASAMVPGNDDMGVAKAIQRYVLAKR